MSLSTGLPSRWRPKGAGGKPCRILKVFSLALTVLVVVHRPPLQTETEGSRAKTLPDLVHRSAGTDGAGAGSGAGAAEERRPIPPDLVVEGGRPLARLAAVGGTGGCFLGRPRLVGCAGEASEGIKAGLSREMFTTSCWVLSCSLKEDW